MSVPASSLAAQPIGEIERVFQDLYQLKLPVPFPLKFVSSYLIRGDGGWTVVDPGFDYPEARAVWERGAEEIGLDLDSDVERIIVTHLHPDHIGLARWMQSRSNAPVFMLEKEIEDAKVLWNPNRDGEELVRFMLRNGLDEKTARSTVATTDAGVVLPDEILPLWAGDETQIGDREFRVIHTPGHSDHHFMLHDERTGTLLAGDHLLLKITPNIGLWPYTEPEPLRRYMDSLKGLRGLAVDTVLPGHGPLFHDLDGRIDELLAHHEERLDVMHAILAAEPGESKTAYRVSQRAFTQDLTLHQLRFALAETLAHLELLADDGRAARNESDGVVRFRAV